MKAVITATDIEINEVDRENSRHVEAQKKLIRLKDQEFTRT
jgi:hypothetical protein